MTKTCGLSLAVGLATGSAAAQDVTGASAQTSATSVQPGEVLAQAGDGQEIAPGDIVVTARNRAERLQDAPISITALGAQQLENTGVRSVRDISNQTPGLVIGGSGEYFNSPALRGLVSVSGNSDPTVATFFDGNYLGSTGANNVALLDIDRVEVVKGPVNSLYGRPAYAGAINYISRTPTDRSELRTQLTIGNDGQARALIVGGFAPIPGILKVRAAVQYDKFSGSYKDSVTGVRAGGYVKKDGQISFAFTPSDSFTATGRYYHGSDRFNQTPISTNDNNCGAINSYGLNPVAPSYFCGKFDPKQHPVEVSATSGRPYISANDRKIDTAFLRLNYAADFADLSTLTTYTKSQSKRYADFFGQRDGLPFFLVPIQNPQPRVAPTAAQGALLQKVGINFLFGSVEPVKDFAQEIRLTSKQDQRLRWTTGAYYADFQIGAGIQSGLDAGRIPAGFTISGNATSCAVFNCDRGFLTPDGSPSDLISRSFTDGRIWSGFLGGEFDVVPALTVSLDGRYTSDRRRIDNQRTTNAPGVFRPLGAPQSKTFKNWTYRGSVRYKFTDDIMAYATIANGVKAGGFNTAAAHVEELPYDVEKNTTYEIGTKTQLFDRRVTFNLSAFYIKLKGLQLSGPSRFADTIGTITGNFGAATSKGFEAEAAVRAADWLNLRGGLSYADSTFDKGVYDFSFAPTCAAIGAAGCDQSRIVSVSTAAGNRTAYDLGGLQIRNQAAWTANAGADVNYDVGDDWELFGTAQYRYQSKQYMTVQAVNWYGPLNRFDLRAGVAKGPVRITAYVENLTNNRTPDQAVQSTLTNDFSLKFFGYMPILRRYGLTLDYKFF